jgi:ribosomal-protein-alanine N-acetyltransferase
LQSLIASPGVFILKAQSQDEISGFVMVRMVMDEAEILTITVAPALRGRKIAARLMEAACAHVLAAGVTSLFLEVAEDNEPALALYKGLGFGEVGRRPAYYARPAGPVGGLIMALSLR